MPARLIAGSATVNAQSADPAHQISSTTPEVEAAGQLISTTDAATGKLKVVGEAAISNRVAAKAVTPSFGIETQREESNRSNLNNSRDTTERASLDPNDQQLQQGLSLIPSISADGRFVAFIFSNPNGTSQVYVRDVRRGTTELINVNRAGQPSAGRIISGGTRISATGRYVVFSSNASDLVSDDTNEATDVFVRDRLTGITERISISSSRAQTESGSFSLFPVVSANGRYVAFSSDAANLVEGDTNQTFDIFVRDRLTNTTTLVSRSSAGEQANSNSIVPNISVDGRFISLCVNRLKSGSKRHKQRV